MITLKLYAPAPPLRNWGAPEDLGGETLDGNVRIEGATLLGTGRSRLSAGWFAATQGRFRLVYPFHEHATLVKGHVSLTREADGVTESFVPGDSWIIPKGTSIIWHVHSAKAVKHFMAAFDDIEP